MNKPSRFPHNSEPGFSPVPSSPGVVSPPRNSVTAPATPPKMPCLECDGEGTVEIMALDETHPHCAECDECDGTGLVAPYCGTCQGKLTVDGYCYSCQEYAEGLAPEGWLRAETSAFGMPGAGRDFYAQGIEAHRATTAKQGVVHESPVAESDAPNPGRQSSLNREGGK